MGFEVTFLGTSGGPIEGATCSILLKPDHLSYEQLLDEKLDNHLICIDAGSGLSRLSEVVHNESMGISKSNLLNLYNDCLNIEDYLKLKIATPFSNLLRSGYAPLARSMSIVNLIRSYLITHPHLDHVCALVINSPNFKGLKSVYGSAETVQGLDRHIFNGLVWPRLQDYDILKFNELFVDETVTLNASFNVRMFQLSHGKPPPPEVVGLRLAPKTKENGYAAQAGITHAHSCYSSSAFLIQNILDKRYLLIFGDFESDSSSQLKLNHHIWTQIAPLIINGSLAAVVLECSSLANPSTSSELYGHLNPVNLYQELIKLNSIVLGLSHSESSLRDFNIIINHVKESEDGLTDPRRRVLEELEQLNEEHSLGIKFSIALTGISVIV